ncbi:MAG TPA: hypothetical protein VMR75_03860 [Candidatus Saccharimonadales bacterium]|nr:hypothetical protein [Candidatus Saccharimonadales bacterium]
MVRIARVFIVLGLLAAPLVVRADPAVTTAPAIAGSSSSLQSTGQSGESGQTSTLLQPAGTSSSALQSAQASASSVAQSGTQDIQQSGSSDQDKLLVESEGDIPQVLNSSSSYSWLGYVLLVLIATTLGTEAASLLQRRFA